MADFLSLAETTLQSLVSLESRVNESSGSLKKAALASQAHIQALATDEQSCYPRLEEVSGQLVELEKLLAERAQPLAQQVELQAADVDRKTQELQADQKAALENLAALRQALTQLASQVQVVQNKTQNQLQRVRGETETLLKGTVKALDDCEQQLANVTRPRLEKAGEGIRSRARQLESRVKEHLLVRMSQEADQFCHDIETLAKDFADLVKSSRQSLLTLASQHTQTFQKQSETDWNGGSGSVDASSRVTALDTAATHQRTTVDTRAQNLRRSADSFNTAVQSNEEQYRRIHDLPRQIDDILNRVGV